MINKCAVMIVNTSICLYIHINKTVLKVNLYFEKKLPRLIPRQAVDEIL